MHGFFLTCSLFKWILVLSLKHSQEYVQSFIYTIRSLSFSCDASTDQSHMIIIPQDSEPVTSLALSPDGRLIFIASRSPQLRAFSILTGELVRTFRGHKAPIADMAVDATGTLLATASADRSVRVWDIDGGYCTHSFTGHRYDK